MEISVDEADIPDQTPWQDRSKLEAGFMHRLREQAAAAMARQFMGQMLMQQAMQEVEEARARRQQAFHAKVARRGFFGFILGLVPGITMAVSVHGLTDSWIAAVLVAIAIATAISKVAVHLSIGRERVTRAAYETIPEILGILVGYNVYLRPEKGGVIAALIAFIVWIFLLYILKRPALETRRAIVALGTWGWLAFFAARRLL
jgi:hypothetical protein